MKKRYVIGLWVIFIIIISLLFYEFSIIAPLCGTPYTVRDSETGQCKIYVGCKLPPKLTEDITCRAELSPEIKGALDNTINIYLNQTLNIEGEGLKLKITGFSNSPCPEGAQCIWSGAGIFYEIQKNGEIKKFTSDKGSDTIILGYKIRTIKTDYNSYAKVIVSKE